MRFLFVVDPVDTLKGYKDSSVAMMRSNTSTERGSM